MPRATPTVTLLFLLLCPTILSAQWQGRVQAGLVQASGSVGPPAETVHEKARSGFTFGGAIEYAFDTRWSLAFESAWRERGVQRYFRLQRVEEHRYRTVDFGILLRMAPWEGRLRPHLLGGVGLGYLLDAYVELGFHERHHFRQGTEGMRRTQGFVMLGGGLRLSLSEEISAGADLAWQAFLQDFYLSEAPGAISFRARDLLFIFSLGFSLE